MGNKAKTLVMWGFISLVLRDNLRDGNSFKYLLTLYITRYKNILPFDETRVKLETGTEEDGSDYINGNHITIPDNKNT